MKFWLTCCLVLFFAAEAVDSLGVLGWFGALDVSWLGAGAGGLALAALSNYRRWHVAPPPPAPPPSPPRPAPAPPRSSISFDIRPRP